MAVPLRLDGPIRIEFILHQDEVDFLKFQYQEKLNKITHIVGIIVHIAAFIFGGILGALYGFPTMYVLAKSQVSSFTFGAVYWGGFALFSLGIYKLWNRWEISLKINHLANSFLAPYQRTYADLNDENFINFAYRVKALNMNQIDKANQCWHHLGRPN